MVEGQIRAGKGQKALDYALNGPATYGYKLTAATLFLDARMYPEAEALLDGLKSDPNAPDEVHFYLAAIAYEYHKDVQETLNFLESIPRKTVFTTGRCACASSCCTISSAMKTPCSSSFRARASSPRNGISGSWRSTCTCCRTATRKP